jgi:hypothetical protein
VGFVSTAAFGDEPTVGPCTAEAGMKEKRREEERERERERED